MRKTQFGICLDFLETPRYKTLNIQPPYGGLLSSSCGGLQPFAAPERLIRHKVEHRTNRLTDGRATGLRDNNIINICVGGVLGSRFGLRTLFGLLIARYTWEITILDWLYYREYRFS